MLVEGKRWGLVVGGRCDEVGEEEGCCGRYRNGNGEVHTDDLFLGYEEGELVFAFVIELAELDTFDFGANVAGKVVYFRAFSKEIRKGWVGIFAVIIMLKRL